MISTLGFKVLIKAPSMSGGTDIEVSTKTTVKDLKDLIVKQMKQYSKSNPKTMKLSAHGVTKMVTKSEMQDDGKENEVQVKKTIKGFKLNKGKNTLLLWYTCVQKRRNYLNCEQITSHSMTSTTISRRHGSWSGSGTSSLEASLV